MKKKYSKEELEKIDKILYKKAKEFKIDKTEEELDEMFKKMHKNVWKRIAEEENKK